MKNLKQIIKEADEQKIAIGHFNISNIEGLWGIFNGAKELNVPVIIGASEGERKFFGTRQVVAVVKSLREEFDYPIYCNADHCHSFESFKEAVDAGFDAVIYDSQTNDNDQHCNILDNQILLVNFLPQPQLVWFQKIFSLLLMPRLLQAHSILLLH